MNLSHLSDQMLQGFREHCQKVLDTSRELHERLNAMNGLKAYEKEAARRVPDIAVGVNVRYTETELRAAVLDASR